MKIIHLKECQSTQTYLKENLEKLTEQQTQVLVTTDQQDHGFGRAQSPWHFYQNSLAFSFTLTPKLRKVTWIPLKIGILLCHYFQENFPNFNLNLSLKWPNDLMNSFEQKCGGIIINVGTAHQQEILIVGIGLNLIKGPLDQNLYSDVKTNYKVPMGYIFQDKKNLQEEEILQRRSQIPSEIYEYILRKSELPMDLEEEWVKLCRHMHRPVEIHDGKNVISGTSEGIGERGQAVLWDQVHQRSEHVYSGSLYFT